MESRTFEPTPSAPTIRSASMTSPVCNVSRPAGSAATASELTAISTPTALARFTSAWCKWLRVMTRQGRPLKVSFETDLLCIQVS